MEKIEKINVEALTEEQVQNLSQELGVKLAHIINKAAEEARVLTKNFGLDIQLGYRLSPIEELNKNS